MKLPTVQLSAYLSEYVEEHIKFKTDANTGAICEDDDDV
jgi:hypothetical protein